ncbi:MAG: tRNA pseudouridine(38-40) synthase TruA [Solirubrobacterales bacterium]
MTVFRIDLAYHGAGFSGWAEQPGRRTVEGEMRDALNTVLGERLPLAVAGRTDAGVHALAQVASFISETPRSGRELRQALNGLTSGEISVRSVQRAGDGFDARRDARSRTYCYRLLASAVPNPFERGLSLWWPHRFDPEALSACGKALAGNHDFRAFTPTRTAHSRFERTILKAAWRFPPEVSGSPDGQPEGICEFWIEAPAFMRGMVRALVGTMLEVGGGRRTLDDFLGLLEGESRQAAGDSARAHGLYLANVSYSRS